jgi:hypothetical protein
MKRYLLSAIAASALATGCYTQGDVGVGYSYGYAQTAGPDLYYLQPGVSVVAYADYPTFYADNAYWMYRDNLWYRSNYWGGGWGVSYQVPNYVRGINRPYSYTRFQPGQGWQRTSAGGSYNPRGYRPNTSAPTPAYAPQRGNGRARGGYQAPANRSYTPPARSGGDNAPARSSSGSRGGGGPTVRDHRRR